LTAQRSRPLGLRIYPSKKDFPPVAESSPELREKIYNKWKKVIEG
jgi:hypothetical protein